MFVGLKIKDAADVEIHAVQIKAEVVAAHIREQLGHGRRLGAARIVLAIDQLLAVGRLHALIAGGAKGKGV
jgi:hypothetical protein